MLADLSSGRVIFARGLLFTCAIGFLSAWVAPLYSAPDIAIAVAWVALFGIGRGLGSRSRGNELLAHGLLGVGFWLDGSLLRMAGPLAYFLALLLTLLLGVLVFRFVTDGYEEITGQGSPTPEAPPTKTK